MNLYMRTLIMIAAALALLACGPQTDAPEEPAGLENGSFDAELNGFKIHYEVHGTGPVVMTVPNSWGLSHQGLRAIYRSLEDAVTMVYFDPRGMGRSGPVREQEDMGMKAVRDDFNALRMHLGLDKVHAIGWSNGATNLIHLAGELPGTLQSATFVHGAASFTEEDMKLFMEKKPDMMTVYADFMEYLQDDTVSDEDKTARLRQLWLEEFFPLSFADRESAVAAIGELFKDASFNWQHAGYSQTENRNLDIRDKLAAVTMPSLIVAGSHDMIPLSKAEEMDQGIPDSKLAVFENSGHYAPVEEPDLFRKTFLEFIGAAE